MPIYMILAGYDYNLGTNVYRILGVVETTLEEYSEQWKIHAKPLMDSGISFTVFIFYREVKNPFKDYLSNDEWR